MIKVFDTFGDVLQHIKPLFARMKPTAVPYEKQVNGIPVQLPEFSKINLWNINEKACEDTLRYIFAISHQCYLLAIVESSPILIKLVPPLQMVYKNELDRAFRNLKRNPHLTDKQRSRIQNMEPSRIMQCVVKERVREEKELDTNEYLDVFSKMKLPDGMFILNLTDAVIISGDQTYPFHMVTGDRPLPHPPAMLPVLSMSGQRGYLDIPIPNYDEIDWVYKKEGTDIYANFVTDWNQKPIAKAVFRGGPTGCGYTEDSNMRIRLLLMSQSPVFSPLLDVGITGNGKTIDTQSVRFDPVYGIGMLNTGLKPTDKRLSMAEQSQYKFIIHVDGNVNAYRMLYTMATGSVILRVMSEYNSWAEQYMVPNEHYIAIAPDLTNLKLKMEWCLLNPKKCKEISERAQHLAKTLLSREFLDNYFKMVFSTFSSHSVKHSYDEYKRTRKKVVFERLPQVDPSARQARVALIVPHRNRIEHLKELLTRLASYDLKGNILDVYLIDQNNSDKFNRGLLLNIGFYLASKLKYDRYLLHDVDSYPDELLFPQYFQFLDDTVHFAAPALGYKYKYEDFLGGVEGFTEQDYITINGYPNNFLGWGGEDDALYDRLAAEKITVYRPTKGKYILADHDKPKDDEKNQLKYENILEDLKNYKNNGIKQLPDYSIQVTPFLMEDFISTYQLEKPNPSTKSGEGVPLTNLVSAVESSTKESNPAGKVELSQFKMEPKKGSMNMYAFKVQYTLTKNKALMPSVKQTLKAKEPEKEEIPETELVQDTLQYIPSVMNVSISVPFQNAGRNMNSYFVSYAEEHLEARCWKEGYVRKGSSKVMSYTAGLLEGTSIGYNVLYLVEVCYPYESMEVDCMVQSVNKIGIQAIIREKYNPMVLYITREHNEKIDMEEYKIGQQIKVRVLGHRYEPGDPNLVVMAEVV
jgi:hypothetical protein